MNRKISEFLKRLTISILLLIFSFVLLTPTANALEYDPKLRRSVIKPNGDGDPWNEVEIYDPPPPSDFNIITLLTIFILKKYDYFQYEQMVDTNNRKITQKQRDERINRKTQNRRFSY